MKLGLFPEGSRPSFCINRMDYLHFAVCRVIIIVIHEELCERSDGLVDRPPLCLLPAMTFSFRMPVTTNERNA